MPYAVLAFGEGRLNDNIIGTVEYLDLAIEKDPKNSSAFLWRGIRMNALGFFDDAKEDFGACLAMDPGYLNCKHHLAASYLYSGDEQRALEIYEPTLDANFHSMSEAFVPVYAANGERTVALLLADIKFNLSAAPVVDWIEAIERPGDDHTAGLERWRLWEKSNSANASMDNIPIVYLAFGAYDEFANSAWADLYVWHPDAAGFRSTALFKDYVRRTGMLAYWQAQRFPDFCRPLGDDDFSCDDPF
jgi:tetratricopeptide (TPR) repeat protein